MATRQRLAKKVEERKGNATVIEEEPSEEQVKKVNEIHRAATRIGRWVYTRCTKMVGPGTRYREDITREDVDKYVKEMMASYIGELTLRLTMLEMVALKGGLVLPHGYPKITTDQLFAGTNPDGSKPEDFTVDEEAPTPAAPPVEATAEAGTAEQV